MTPEQGIKTSESAALGWIELAIKDTENQLEDHSSLSLARRLGALQAAAAALKAAIPPDEAPDEG